MSDRAAGAFEVLLEVIVVGVGGLVLLALAMCAIAGADVVTVVQSVGDGTALVLGLPLSAAAGVLADRLADRITESWWRNALDDVLPAHETRIARLDSLAEPALADRLEYLRVRYRIARGWALICAALVVVWPVYSWQVHANRWPALATGGALCFAALTAGNIFAWRSLRIDERKQLKVFGDWRRQSSTAEHGKPRGLS